MCRPSDKQGYRGRGSIEQMLWWIFGVIDVHTP